MATRLQSGCRRRTAWPFCSALYFLSTLCLIHVLPGICFALVFTYHGLLIFAHLVSFFLVRYSLIPVNTQLKRN